MYDFNGCNNKTLVLAAPAKHTLLCSANKELIHMNIPCKRIVTRAFHCLLYLPFKLPVSLFY